VIEDGRVYNGFWVDHKREARGTFKHTNEDVYKGN